MHPNEIQLSLYAGGDLPLLERFRTGLHVRGCQNCAAKVESIQRTITEVKLAGDEMPPNLKWDRLAAEMTGNIRVGLAAGECVARGGGKPERLGWRAATVLASATALIMTAWWLNIPPTRHPVATASENGVRLEATSSGLELNQNGRSLVILHKNAGAGSTVFVSTPGSLRARYVNTETGQMTINNVYAQ